MPRKAYRRWTEEQDAILRDGIRDGLSNAQIAAKFSPPRSISSIENRIVDLGCGRFGPAVELTREITSRHGATVLAPISTSPVPDDEFLAAVLRKTGQSVTSHQQERYVRLRIVSDRPVGISVSADWHLTADGSTDVQGLVEHAEAVRDTDGAFAINVGDSTDNPVKHGPTDVGDVPDDLRLLDIVIGKFGGKLLGMTSGNHDDWTRTMVGVDSLKTMAERHQLHYAPDELVWLVEIVSPKTEHVTARWVIATRHKYNAHSNLNMTHACWRWLERNANNWPSDGRGGTLLPDVVAIGHNHCAAVEHRTYEGRTVVAIRPGSWQYTSPFTRAGGWTLMPPTAPIVILPAVRDLIAKPHGFEDWRAGLNALRQARQGRAA